MGTVVKELLPNPSLAVTAHEPARRAERERRL